MHPCVETSPTSHVDGMSPMWMSPMYQSCRRPPPPSPSPPPPRPLCTSHVDGMSPVGVTVLKTCLLCRPASQPTANITQTFPAGTILGSTVHAESALHTTHSVQNLLCTSPIYTSCNIYYHFTCSLIMLV